VAEIKRQRNIETHLIKGSGGQFEVVLDGKLIFSKKQVGRFPEPQEILDQIPA
jgi:selT/selW/selH-like putative selenoprotein